MSKHQNLDLTPYDGVNAMAHDLVARVHTALGDQVVGVYLEGSLANGDFDDNSDIDFVVVTRDEVSHEQFEVLRAMHAEIGKGDSRWALDLEGSYISRGAIRRYDPMCSVHPNIERGPGEQLKQAEHDSWWLIHCYILRERGIVVIGPPPETLIDPISPDDLRQAARSILRGWATNLLTSSHWDDSDGYHSYIVLTLCRILYTIETGNIVSKRAAAMWARTALADPWRELVEQAWVVRQTWQDRQPGMGSLMVEHADNTRAFIRYALDR